MPRITTTCRSVPEWIGASPDAKIPGHVRLRIFERHEGICHISGRKILAGEKWEAEHIVPLADGGEHRESNLAPALLESHRKKTAQEAKVRAKVRRVRKKHLGIEKSKNLIPGSRGSRWKRTIDGRTIER